MTDGNTQGQRINRGIRRMACGLAVGMAVAVAVPHAALAQTVTPPPVPEALQLKEPQEAFLVGHAIGTQNYICQPSGPIGHVAWTLFTPQATLFGEEQEQLTTHFFDPNPDERNRPIRAAWEHSGDTSTVWGAVAASSTDANFVAGDAIPWLLVEIVGARRGPTGGGALFGTTFIHRLNTQGGRAPATGCDHPPDIGKKAFVPYRADYFFYRR